MNKPVVGVSGCLLGDNVRFNGGHKHSRLVTEVFSQLFEFRAFCPEVAAGMGTPRPAIRLVQRADGTRAEFSTAQPGLDQDVTDVLRSTSESLADTMSDLDGFVLTQKSPSCGMGGVKLYHANGNPVSSTRGLFAEALLQRYPDIPMEDSGRLNDDVLRENFVARVVIYHEWKHTVAHNTSAKAVLDFHTRHKFTVLAHSVEAYKQLGRLLSDLSQGDIDNIKKLAKTYFSALMRALAIPASRKRHTNVLQHLQGYVKDFMAPEEKRALSEAIEHYRQGHVPLVVPVTLLRCFAQTHASQTHYLNQQSYLRPYPVELRLRNGI